MDSAATFATDQLEEIQVINNHIQAAVAAERRRDLLGRKRRSIARSGKRGCSVLGLICAPPATVRFASWLAVVRPAAGNASRGRPAVPCDGSEVLIRPVEAGGAKPAASNAR